MVILFTKTNWNVILWSFLMNWLYLVDIWFSLDDIYEQLIICVTPGMLCSWRPKKERYLLGIEFHLPYLGQASGRVRWKGARRTIIFQLLLWALRLVLYILSHHLLNTGSLSGPSRSLDSLHVSFNPHLTIQRTWQQRYFTGEGFVRLCLSPPLSSISRENDHKSSWGIRWGWCWGYHWCQLM